MKNFLANFNKYRTLLGELVVRDIKTKYRRSVLGVLWSLLNPLLMMIVLSIVFSQLFKFNVDNYPLYLLSGQVIFNFFSESTTKSMNAILENASLIKKVYLPKYMFVVSRTLSNAVNLMAYFAALIIVMLVTRAELHYSILLSVIPILCLVVLSLGVGMLIASWAVKFRDIIHLYSILITVLMYLTPVIYPVSILPDWVYHIVMANPISSILTMFRGFVIYGTMPDWYTWVMSIVPGLVIFGLGCLVFKKEQDKFILYL